MNQLTQKNEWIARLKQPKQKYLKTFLASDQKLQKNTENLSKSVDALRKLIKKDT